MTFQAQDGIMFVFSILFIVIQLLLLNYLIRLEKIGCECAMDWRRNFMMFYMVVTIVHMIAITIAPRDIMPSVQTIVAVLGLLNVIFTLQYVSRLRREKCECSESLYKDVITLVALFNAFVYILLLVIVLYTVFSLSMNTMIPKKQRSAISVRPLFKKKSTR